MIKDSERVADKRASMVWLNLNGVLNPQPVTALRQHSECHMWQYCSTVACICSHRVNPPSHRTRLILVQMAALPYPIPHANQCAAPCIPTPTYPSYSPIPQHSPHTLPTPHPHAPPQDPTPPYHPIADGSPAPRPQGRTSPWGTRTAGYTSTIGLSLPTRSPVQWHEVSTRGA